ncbi:MAG: hypothetical protein IJ468_04805 [Lachnospiraceae bacterium]|nr:hypothetical protein [Lachnospiraceae bacterium]
MPIHFPCDENAEEAEIIHWYQNSPQLVMQAIERNLELVFGAETFLPMKSRMSISVSCHSAAPITWMNFSYAAS